MAKIDDELVARRVNRYGAEIGGAAGTPGRATMTSRLPASARSIARAVIAEMNGVAPGADAMVARAADGSGQALPGALRSRFEQSLGADLGGVRVHTDSHAATAAESLGARAYATGQDVYMGAGQYRPDSADGAWLLAHEVAHTVQQRGASAAPACKLDVSAPGDAMETEADAAADAMISGAPASISTHAPAIHRQTIPAGARPQPAQPAAGGAQGGATPELLQIVTAHFQDLFDQQVIGIDRLARELQSTATHTDTNILAPLITAAVVAAINVLTDGAATGVAAILASLASQAVTGLPPAPAAADGAGATGAGEAPATTAGGDLASRIIRAVGSAAASYARTRITSALTETAGQPPVNQFIDSQRTTLLDSKVAARDAFITHQPELASAPDGGAQARAILRVLEDQRAHAASVQYFESLKRWAQVPAANVGVITVTADVPHAGAHPAIQHITWPGTSDAVRNTLATVHGDRTINDLGVDVVMHIVVSHWRPFFGSFEFDMTKVQSEANIQFEGSGSAHEFLADYIHGDPNADVSTRHAQALTGAAIIWSEIGFRHLSSVGVMSGS
jgi:hypothetical protein